MLTRRKRETSAVLSLEEDGMSLTSWEEENKILPSEPEL
jgi:hypothetical protein